MNILYTQPSFSAFWGSGSSYPRALKDLGHNVIALSTGWPSFDMDKNEVFSYWMSNTEELIGLNSSQLNFDLFISFIGDRISYRAIKYLQERGVKTLNWDELDPSPDLRRDMMLRSEDIVFPMDFYEKMRCYDAVFCASALGPNWLPLASYYEPWQDETMERTTSIAFVGNLDNEWRRNWMDRFEKFDVVTHFKHLPYQMVKSTYSSSKIVINRHQNSCLNGRTFEAVSCGALLVTDYTPGLEKCFEIGKEIVVYDSYKDGVEEVEYYLENEKERKKIAKAGLERTKREHKIQDRFQEMIKRFMAGDYITWKDVYCKGEPFSLDQS